MQTYSGRDTIRDTAVAIADDSAAAFNFFFFYSSFQTVFFFRFLRFSALLWVRIVYWGKHAYSCPFLLRIASDDALCPTHPMAISNLFKFKLGAVWQPGNLNSWFWYTFFFFFFFHKFYFFSTAAFALALALALPVSFVYQFMVPAPAYWLLLLLSFFYYLNNYYFFPLQPGPITSRAP